MFIVLMLAAIAAARYGFLTTSPTLALMAWIGGGGFLAFALGFKGQPKLEWVRPIRLRPFFSARVFLVTLAGLGLFMLLGSGGSRQAAWELTLFGVTPATVVVTLLSVLCLWEGEWRPDPRPWKDRTYVSGQAWVSMALVLFPADIILLLLLR